MVDQWLKTNTFHHSQFADTEELLKFKKQKNLTISLGLPTKNVGMTLEPILSIIKQEFMENSDLVDEIAIIDSHSTDDTVKIAKDLGIDVYFEDEILKSAGVQRGKGEALWKSLAVLKGDIVIWIDSDIRNIHPRFVYGLLGPLLIDERIDYVKAYYKRPIKIGETWEQTGGGRVTELTVRPILNLFYSQLSGFIQPLSGEYGGRRKLLESIPFYTGYAVETGLLVEIERQKGLEVMAQVDLEERVHENQSTLALGKMSFAILQAVFEMLQEDGKLSLNQDINKTLQNVQCLNGVCQATFEEIEVVKRPPIKEVPEYQEIRKKK